jgi:hypothetical protein
MVVAVVTSGSRIRAARSDARNGTRVVEASAIPAEFSPKPAA